MLISKFKGPLEFLSLDYPCNVNFNGKIYPTLFHAMIAAKDDDSSMQDLILNSDIDTVKVLNKEVCKNTVEEDVYSDRLVQLVINKFSDRSIYEKLIALVDPEDDIYYEDDFNNIISSATKIIRDRGLDYNTVIENLILR